MDWLTLIWAGLIAVAVFMYVLMDGFDLGVGVLFPFAKTEGERDVMMNTVAPIWDGNETWLILGGGGLLAAFPYAYAALLPTLYTPVTIMLLGLIFRGVAFEFRFKAERTKKLWGHAFFGGSLIAAFAQGVTLGVFVQDIVVDPEGLAAAGAWHWLSPYSLVIGAAVAAGYALLGATWLVMKTEAAIQARARRWSTRALFAVIWFMALVSLAMPVVNDRVSALWFTVPNFLILAPIPVATAAVALALWRCLRTGREVAPFLCAMGLFALGFLGLAISMFPYVAPGPDGALLTIWETHAPREAQVFMLIGAGVTLPAIFAYTGYVYWLFRGKVREGEGYAH